MLGIVAPCSVRAASNRGSYPRRRILSSMGEAIVIAKPEGCGRSASRRGDSMRRGSATHSGFKRPPVRSPLDRDTSGCLLPRAIRVRALLSSSSSAACRQEFGVLDARHGGGGADRAPYRQSLDWKGGCGWLRTRLAEAATRGEDCEPRAKADRFRPTTAARTDPVTPRAAGRGNRRRSGLFAADDAIWVL